MAEPSLALITDVTYAVPVSAIAIDTENTVRGWNPAAEELFEIPGDVAIGRKIHELDLNDRAPALTALIEDVKGIDAPIPTYEMSLTRRSGHSAIVAVIVKTVVDQDRRTAGLVLYADERTGHVALRQELRTIREELKELRVAHRPIVGEMRDAGMRRRHRIERKTDEERLGNINDVTDRPSRDPDRDKEEFVAMLSHELRNPLGAVQNAIRIIGAHPDNGSAVQEARAVLQRRVAHLVRLLDDLLDVSRTTLGKVVLRKTIVNLATIVADALEMSRPMIEARGHDVAVSLPREPIHLDGDPARLEQIVANVLNNAAKYTPPNGHITVTAGRNGGVAVLRIRDTGIGIEREVLPHVFELFWQGDHSLARTEGGLGIGLTLVRRLVAMHGGTVTVDSEGPGKGTEVMLQLPLGYAAGF